LAIIAEITLRWSYLEWLKYMSAKPLLYMVYKQKFAWYSMYVYE